MKELVGTIDLRPTPEAYADSLSLILGSSTSAKDRAWARDEIRKAFKAAARRNPEAWGGEPPAPAPNTEVITAAGIGTVEKVGEIQIPDLWHIATLFDEAAAIAKKHEDNKPAGADFNERAKIAIPSSLAAERISEDIKKTWHYALSLRSHILAH